MYEREKQAYNILVFGVKEIDSHDQDNTKSKEKKRIENILKDVKP